MQEGLPCINDSNDFMLKIKKKKKNIPKDVLLVTANVANYIPTYFNKQYTSRDNISIKKWFPLHQCLHFTFAHLDNTKRSIVSTEVLRVSRVCSNKNNFNKHWRTWDHGFMQEAILNYKFKKKWVELSLPSLRGTKGKKKIL